MKLSEIVALGKDRIRAADLQCADPLLHMKQIVMAALGIDNAKLYLSWDDELNLDSIAKVEAFLVRRLSGEPFQYIAGYEWFWETKFEVGPGCLIPRRETEFLVEWLLEWNEHSRMKLAELGPGSGNIGISVLKERPHWQWHAFELNPDTLPYLRRNLKSTLSAEVEANYHLHCGDFFTEAKAWAPYEVVVSNPPYVARETLDELAKEVRHEPVLALDGGPGGLQLMTRFVAEAKQLLVDGGWFLSEIGSDQEEAVKSLLSRNGFENVRVLNDYSGLARVAIGQKKPR